MRRLLVLALFICALVQAATQRGDAVDLPQRIRIGYQKNGDLVIVKQRGTLATALAKQGVGIDWVLFSSGPPMLEALNAGSIDFGATGDTPPIFAQAAGAHLVYVAAVPVPGDNQAILVRRQANIATLADLRGKRLAYTRGSSANWLVAKTLEKAHLAFADVQSINLQPPDAAAAFQNGSIDAWAIWDPFYALGQRFPDARVLTTSREVAPSNAFFLASGDFAAKYPGVIVGVVDSLKSAAAWERTHRSELAKLLSASTGVDLPTEEIAAARGYYDAAYLTPPVIAQEQTLADTFFKLGLIPHPVDVRSAVWTPAR